MYTADRFQGRDKEVVIISLVRSNDQNNVGELLRDWRRINVAFTRARSKLIILGSKSTLSSNELLRDFVSLMEKKKWVYRLPENAHLLHQCPEISSIMSAVTPRKRKDSGNDMDEQRKEKAKRPSRRSPKRIDGRKILEDQDGVLGRRAVLGNIVNDML